MLKIIYCAGGNKRFAEIAIEHGFLYGSRLPSTTYYSIFFADQEWKEPNRDRYTKLVKQEKPYMASVIDVDDDNKIDEAKIWAEEIAPSVNKIIMIPKIDFDIPLSIGGKEVIVGYSVPTRYGGTSIPIERYLDRKIHLLGGSPHKQMDIYRKYPKSIYSIDGNYHQAMAIRHNKVWERNYKRAYGKWTKLSDYLGEKCDFDCPYRAFDISCENIIKEWIKLQRIV